MINAIDYVCIRRLNWLFFIKKQGCDVNSYLLFYMLICIKNSSVQSYLYNYTNFIDVVFLRENLRFGHWSLRNFFVIILTYWIFLGVNQGFGRNTSDYSRCKMISILRGQCKGMCSPTSAPCALEIYWFPLYFIVSSREMASASRTTRVLSATWSG